MWFLQVAGFVFFFLHYSKAGSNEDFRLLEDSFAEAYDEGRLGVPFAVSPRGASPEKRNNVPRQQIAQGFYGKSFTKMTKPVYQPYRPAVIARQYHSGGHYSLTPQRSGIFNRERALLPHRINYLQSPKRNIASFARRNPYYTKPPKLLPVPRRNTVMVSRGSPGYRRPFMYNPILYQNLFLRNPKMNAQRRGFMYRSQQQRLSPYLARRRIASGPAILRSITPRFYYRKPANIYAYRNYRPRPYVYARDQSLSSNHLNLNMGTSSHTQSHSILKAPGHTSTDTHVVNKQQTGGRVRGVAPALKGKQQAYHIQNAKYPFMKTGFRAREKVSASAKVNAKASSSSQSSSSQSGGSSTSNTNGGSRKTSSGGWGGGAGAGWGSGPNAWGIGYGGGGGGSNWKIPSGMIGIPGMPGKFPGIPQGFPGMPPGGYPSQGTYIGASKQSNAKRPSSTLKGKKVSLKPKKGLDDKAFKKPQGIGKSKSSTALKVATKFRAFPARPKSKVLVSPATQGKLYRVQFFTSDPLTRPVSNEWQKLRQRIISNVLQD